MSKRKIATGSKRRSARPAYLSDYSTLEDADFDVAAATAAGTWAGTPHPALVSIGRVAYPCTHHLLPLVLGADAKVASSTLLSSAATRALERAASAAPTAAKDYKDRQRVAKLRENLVKARATLAAGRDARRDASSSAASNNPSREEEGGDDDDGRGAREDDSEEADNMTGRNAVRPKNTSSSRAAGPSSSSGRSSGAFVMHRGGDSMAFGDGDDDDSDYEYPDGPWSDETKARIATHKWSGREPWGRE
jgi:hypothetical protein